MYAYAHCVQMSLPYTNEDLMHSHHMNVMAYNIRNSIRNYFRNLIDSTNNSAKLLCASVSSCINAVFPSCFKYTALSICLSIVETDLKYNRIPEKINSSSHMHDV